MKTKPTSYQAFILRLWREPKENSMPWRIVLVNPQTGERKAFTAVEQFSKFLHQQMTATESCLHNQGDQNDTN